MIGVCGAVSHLCERGRGRVATLWEDDEYLRDACSWVGGVSIQLYWDDGILGAAARKEEGGMCCALTSPGQLRLPNGQQEENMFISNAVVTPRFPLHATQGFERTDGRTNSNKREVENNNLYLYHPLFLIPFTFCSYSDSLASPPTSSVDRLTLTLLPTPARPCNDVVLSFF